jgi:hypothetical protein
MMAQRWIRDLAQLAVWCGVAGFPGMVAFPQRLPDLYSDEIHGDPPFLREVGWRRLLTASSLAGWHGLDGKEHEWFTSRSVYWRRVFGPTRLDATPKTGDRILNGKAGKTANLVTDEKFGDLELYLEFMMAKGSNSGIYLHGLYEVQIFDSFGYSGPLTVGDCGGIYHRGKDLGGGSPPQRNACRAPGEWQSLHIWFRSPRFDAAGRKTAHARFLRVLLNETLVQENVELEGPTQGHMNLSEAADNPLMLQGDHGPVAFRNIYVRPLR